MGGGGGVGVGIGVGVEAGVGVGLWVGVGVGLHLFRGYETAAVVVECGENNAEEVPLFLVHLVRVRVRVRVGITYRVLRNGGLWKSKWTVMLTLMLGGDLDVRAWV